MGVTLGKFIGVLMLAGILLAGCSSTRWVPENKGTIDKNEYKILNTDLFLMRTDNLTPNEPVVKFGLMSAGTVEYAERVRTNRYIQNYKPRIGYVVFGLTSAVIAGYAVFSNDLITRPTQGQKLALTGTGLALAGLSFLNMKPVGEPLPTGESRLLSRSGSIVQTDTLAIKPDSLTIPEYEITMNNRILVKRKKGSFNGDLFTINMSAEIEPEALPDDDNLNIGLVVYFADSTYHYDIPVASVYEPFIEVTSDITRLRTSPEESPGNILTELAKGSRLQYAGRNGGWIKVLYGITETWVEAKDVNKIWRSSEFADALSIIPVSNVPFGSIDVEKNIPTTVAKADNRWAFIVANGNYNGTLQPRSTAERDSRLMYEYFSRTLGVPAHNLQVYEDLARSNDLVKAVSALKENIGQLPAELIVYISGYARLDAAEENVYLIGTTDDSLQVSGTNLNNIFSDLAQLPLTKVSVIVDLDFVKKYGSKEAPELLAKRITGKIDKSLVVFASQTDQHSLVYSSAGENKYHSVFTYFMADALKRGYTNWSAILNYVQRSVSYTSRSVFNTAQDISYFGDVSLDLSR